MLPSRLAEREIVLLGVGHTHAHVLRMWRMEPIADARLTCVSNFPVATYSGMLPGVLAGQYSVERMQIDLVRLCAANGARLIVDAVRGLDVKRRQLLFADRPPLSFDILSIGIGSVPACAGVELVDEPVVMVKPMQTFLARLEARVRQSAEWATARPLRVVVVGGGAGGCEITFCLPARLRQWLGESPFEIYLIHDRAALVPGAAAGTAALVQRELAGRGVQVLLNQRVVAVERGQVKLTDGQPLDADVVVWVAGAAPPPLLESVPLPKDERGFLRVRSTLQTTADAPVFVVGDTASIEDQPIAKAGVYAVRQGPVLWDNLRRWLASRPLRSFHPQRSFLKLLNTGDGRAIGEWKGLRVHRRFVWRWKDAIDRRFMDKYQHYEPMAARPAPVAAPGVMRCAGCGGKVGGPVLAAVLEQLGVQDNEHVMLGLAEADDAAVLRLPGPTVALTSDFFVAPLQDAYLTGRIAALNAASDAYAMNARPIAALAVVGIPQGSPRRQQELLYELLAGAVRELRAMGAALVGGHTIESAEVMIGFTVAADPGARRPWTKAGLEPGDRLLLTKPLGTGILLAGHMQAKCRAEWMQGLCDAMLQSHQEVASALSDLGVSAATDVTGFGLAGHLLEMLRASGVGGRIELAALPLLPGVEALYADQVASTLAPSNREVEPSIAAARIDRESARYAVLFDPQTSGGLLIGVPARAVDRALDRLREAGVPSYFIGEVVDADTPRIELVEHPAAGS